MVRVGVIMAGGSGERFWPVSRHHKPKQLLRLTDAPRSMLQEAVERLLPIIPATHIYVVTGSHLVDAIVEAGIGIPPENVLAEPCKRNTAGCLNYAAAYMLNAHGKDVSMAVVTADHTIGNTDRFRDTILLSLEAAEQHGVLATHGIVPTRPETGYGYVQAQPDSAPLVERDGISVYPVAAFHEKPSPERAEEFLAAGGYFWNSGMFYWTVETYLEEMRAAQPEMAVAIEDMAAAMKRDDTDAVAVTFESLESISIDYALMERSSKVVVARADYPWDDVGDWPSLDRTRERDADGNVSVGKPVLVDCSDCIVYNEPGAEEMAVSVIGADNLVVVVTSDGVLVVPKDRAQDVRQAVQELKSRDAKQV